MITPNPKPSARETACWGLPEGPSRSVSARGFSVKADNRLDKTSTFLNPLRQFKYFLKTASTIYVFSKIVVFEPPPVYFGPFWPFLTFVLLLEDSHYKP